MATKQRMAPSQRSIAKPEKRHLQNFTHSGTVGGGVNAFGPCSLIPASTSSSVNPFSTVVLNRLQSTSTSTLCTSISSSCFSSFRFLPFLAPRPISAAACAPKGEKSESHGSCCCFECYWAELEAAADCRLLL